MYYGTPFALDLMRQADAQCKTKEYLKQRKMEKAGRPPRTRPMPEIEGVPGCGPIRPDPEYIAELNRIAAEKRGPLLKIWKESAEKIQKEAAEKERKEKKKHEDEMITLLGKKARFEGKLAELNPKKKKDSKKIIAFNQQLRDINERILIKQKESGIVFGELNLGSKLQRFWNGLKMKVKKIKKKIRKFYEEWEEPINGALIVGIPAVLFVIFRKIISVIAL